MDLIVTFTVLLAIFFGVAIISFVLGAITEPWTYHALISKPRWRYYCD